MSRVHFSGTSDLLLGRDKARRKALLRQSLARALSTSLDRGLASLDAQGLNEAHPKESCRDGRRLIVDETEASFARGSGSVGYNEGGALGAA